MPQFSIPNTPDAANINLAEPDAGDFRALGDRATGVLTGGSVSALGTPGMSVQVEAASGVLAGVPFSFSGGTVPIQASGGTARFDLVGWTVAGTTVLTGVGSTNPSFPVFDPAVFCLGAAVFVGAGVPSITSAYVVPKAVAMEPSWRRNFLTDAATAIEITAPVGTYKVFADGTHSWGSSTLKRLTTSALEMATQLVVKATDTSLESLLVLKARATTAATQKVMDIQSSVGVSLAHFTGEGKLSAANFRFGTGSPEGTVTAPRGALYIDEAAPDNNTLWYKSTTTGATGWKSLKNYNASESALPIGSLVPWIGASSDTVPTGFVKANGQVLSTNTPANVPLFNLIQYRFGGSASNFNVPNMEGYLPIGNGGGYNLTSGAKAGVTDGQVTLNVSQLPAHNHSVSDPGHVHPQAGNYWYYRPNSYHNNWHPSPDASLYLPHLYVEDNTDKRSTTGVSVGNTGGGSSVGIKPPVMGCTYLIKL